MIKARQRNGPPLAIGGPKEQNIEDLLRGAAEGEAADVGGDDVDVAVRHSDEARVRVHNALVVKLRDATPL